LTSRLPVNDVLPLTSTHFGLSALRREFETKIFISPAAAAFSFTKVKRSSNDTLGKVRRKLVSPS
jgi:hypothetical protein